MNDKTQKVRYLYIQRDKFRILKIVCEEQVSNKSHMNTKCKRNCTNIYKNKQQKLKPQTYK